MILYDILTCFILPVCPSGAQEHEGECYFFSSEEKTWNDAKTACENMHSAYEIVNIVDANLNIFLTQNFVGSQYWTGLNDISIEGTYVWTNGDGLTYGSTLMSDPWQSSNPDVISYFFCRIICL